MKTSKNNLDFNGMQGDGVNRAANRFAGNQHAKTDSDRMINKGRGPTRGNQDHKPAPVGAPATKDAYRPVPSCHEPAVQPGKDMFPASKNPQYRGQGGVAVKGPSDPEGINYGPKKQY